MTLWTTAHHAPLVTFQARILEWVAMDSFRGSSQLRDQTTFLTSPMLASGFFITSTTWKAPLYSHTSYRSPGDSAGKESACNAGDLGSIPGLGRSPGEGKGYPLQYSGLENSMDSLFHGVAKSQKQLTFT